MDNANQTVNNHLQENVTAPNTAPFVNPELNQPTAANTATNKSEKPKIWVFVLLGVVILGVISLIIIELMLPHDENSLGNIAESTLSTSPPISRSDAPLSPTEIFDELERLLSEEYLLTRPPVDNKGVNPWLSSEFFLWTSDGGHHLSLDDSFSRQLLWVPNFESVYCGTIGVSTQIGYRQLVSDLNRNITKLMIDADTGFISNTQNSTYVIGNDGIISWAFENEDYLMMFNIMPECTWYNDSLYIPIVLSGAPRTSLELAYQEQVPILQDLGYDENVAITGIQRSDIDNNFASIGLTMGVGSIVSANHGGLFVFEDGAWQGIVVSWSDVTCREWDTLPDLIRVPRDLRWACFDGDIGGWRCGREQYEDEIWCSATWE